MSNKIVLLTFTFIYLTAFKGTSHKSLKTVLSLTDFYFLRPVVNTSLLILIMFPPSTEDFFFLLIFAVINFHDGYFILFFSNINLIPIFHDRKLHRRTAKALQLKEEKDALYRNYYKNEFHHHAIRHLPTLNSYILNNKVPLVNLTPNVSLFLIILCFQIFCFERFR